MDLYCGNLPYSITQEELINIFENHGKVEKVKIVIDRETGRSKGFAFVTMPNLSEAESAAANLDGVEVSGRKLRVNEARKKD